MTYFEQRLYRKCNPFGYTAKQCPTKPGLQDKAKLPYQERLIKLVSNISAILLYVLSSFSCSLFGVPSVFKPTLSTLVHIGSFCSAITPHFIFLIESNHPETIFPMTEETTIVKVADGNVVSTLGKVDMSLSLGDQHCFECF